MTTKLINVAVVGLDGHGPVFIDALNGDRSVVEGMRVVKAMSYPSVMISAQQLAKNVERTRSLGVAIVSSPDELADGVDGILILHDDGSKHLDLVKLFVDKGKPLFVDKPLEANLSKAKELVNFCRKHNCSPFSASSLRFSLEIMATLSSNDCGKIISAMTYSPYIPKPTMPGWIYYGIHAIEPLYALMGSGCQEVRCIPYEYGPVAIGTWKDGRTGIAKGTVGVYKGHGYAVWREKINEMAVVDSNRIYPELLKNIRNFFETGLSPVNPEESLEVIAFMEAASESMANNGTAIPIKF